MSKAVETLTNYAKRQGADALDIVEVASTDVAVGYRLGLQEKLERAESTAIGLRVFVGKQQAIVSTDAMDETSLTLLAEKAVSMAKASPADPNTGQAASADFAGSTPNLNICDTAEPSVEQLTQTCLEAEETARAVAGVTNSEGAEAGFSRHRFALTIVPPSGSPFSGTYETTSYYTSISVLAGTGTNMEEDYAFSHTRLFADLQEAKALGLEAGERAIKRLNARKMPTTSVPIVWDRRVSKTLLSQFLNAINGSAIARKTSFLKDKMDAAIFAPGIHITDDAHIQKGLGSRPFDGEGIANGKTALIENGVLQSWLLDIRTANQLGLKSTGHASRSLGSPPSPSSTNAYIHSGNISAKELIGSVRDGFYVTDLFGMGINLVTGDFSQGARGFWIEKGEIAFPVSEITIAGKLQDMFMNLTAADDLEFKYATNAPTLLIEGMTVAGS